MAELADAQDLGSCLFGGGGSSPPSRTIFSARVTLAGSSSLASAEFLVAARHQVLEGLRKAIGPAHLGLDSSGRRPAKTEDQVSSTSP